jgi:subtilisin family serine protease
MQDPASSARVPHSTALAPSVLCGPGMRTVLTVVLLTVGGCGPDDSPAAAVVGQRYLLELSPFTQVGVASPALTTAGPGGVLEAEKAALLREVPGVLVVDALEELPMLVVTVRDAQSLTALRAHPQVAHLWEDSAYGMNDAESFPFIGQPQAADAGAEGSGATVAVLDTGLDYRKSDFGTCEAGATGCKVAFTRDFAPDDGQLDDNGHGTNVAGIVLGVAPKARVVGLDVFTGVGAAASDIVAAINWVIANKATYNIVAMNLSLGGGSFTGPCATDVFATPIASARAAGVLAAIASGNGALTNAMSSPACTPEAL